ncbi:hypothetical protein OPKNFCMD_1962 [Methylobacterium crusticola]|uniref:PilZ domain-containing protein n=1 Tax=Methylobacterium crusticola TaxID=1697972 RepID=A0ABQ4QVM6_9HYPH|nr:PilZ domain-containing protein [Methylobacterium crusticola]GJD49232.1 hypothetical protein OPKNFCMD_1962 [Methylobacterium crusticola]
MIFNSSTQGPAGIPGHPALAAAPDAPAVPPMAFRVSGRCLMASGEEHCCLARSLSLDEAEIVAPVAGLAGDPVTIYLDDVGALSGTIRSTMPDGFRVAVEVGPERRARLAARLAWAAAHAGERVDQRRHARIVPAATAVEVRLPDGTCVAGTILDLSMTGAAIALAAQPEVGSVVTAGKRFATVVRHLEGGIGVQFKLPFRPETFSQHVVL